MNQLLRFGIIFAIGLILLDTLTEKGGDTNDKVSAVERNADTGDNRGINRGEHSTSQGDNWNSVTTENLI